MVCIGAGNDGAVMCLLRCAGNAGSYGEIADAIRLAPQEIVIMRIRVRRTCRAGVPMAAVWMGWGAGVPEVAVIAHATGSGMLDSHCCSQGGVS